MSRSRQPRKRKTGKTALTTVNAPENTKRLAELSGSADGPFSTTLLNQVCNSIFLGEDPEEETRDRYYHAAFVAQRGLKPADEAEGMLAAHIVAVHFTAMECLRRAALPNQTFEGRNMALKHAARLSQLFADLLGTMQKLRGKGQQKVTVEHVHVNEGGQAIVGTVENAPRGGGGNRKKRGTTPCKADCPCT